MGDFKDKFNTDSDKKLEQFKKETWDEHFKKETWDEHFKKTSFKDFFKK